MCQSWTGDAIFGNVEFGWIIALSIAIGVTCASIETSVFARYVSPTWTRAAVVAVLVLRLIATDRQEPLLVLMDPLFRNGFEAAEQSVREEAAQVAALDGSVYCSIKVVCRLAGKPFAVGLGDLGVRVDPPAFSKCSRRSSVQAEPCGHFVLAIAPVQSGHAAQWSGTTTLSTEGLLPAEWRGPAMYQRLPYRLDCS